MGSRTSLRADTHIGRASVGRERRLRVERAVWKGRAVEDRADAALAVVRAGEVLRRSRRASGGRPFGRDFLIVAVAAAGLLAVPGIGLYGKLALIAVAVGFLLVLELGLDWLSALRVENARRAEQANVALVLESIAAKYPTVAGPRPRKALPAPGKPEEPSVYARSGIRVA